ncbi:MAG: cysteine desulfurase [Bdellovibrionales bacterium]|nr:cysteine desulfurase [Bdellovibrionales bacterium]
MTTTPTTLNGSMEKPIYLDYNATTPLDPEVLSEMLPFLKEEFGNASSSSHPYGWAANMAVKKARKQVADAIGCEPKEIIWTSGATESNNMAIIGLVRSFLPEKTHIITANTEHKAVLQVFEMAEELGAEITVLPVNEQGQVSVEQVVAALKPHTRLVSLMMANNEIGTLHPIFEIGKMLQEKNILFHTDAAQALGKIPIDLKTLPVDMLSMSGHKIYGPKGVGALYIRKQNPPITLKPLICGGEQEGGLRPGTLNVPGIVGIGTAVDIASKKMTEESTRLTKLRDQLITRVLKNCRGAILNGHPTERLPNNASFSFEGLSADVFALGLSGLALSSGSACTSASGKPSHVITAIGRPECLARATIRVGLGRMTTDKDIETAGDKILAMIEKNSKISNI